MASKPFKSVHVEREEIEQKLEAMMLAKLGEEGPSDLADWFDALLKQRPGSLTAFAAMTVRAQDTGNVEKLGDKYYLTKQGEMLFMAAKGKLPKHARFVTGFTPAQARAVADALKGAREESS